MRSALCIALAALIPFTALAQGKGSPGAAQPTAAQAAAIFTAAWKKHRPDFEVQSVEVLRSEPKQHQDRRWITYKLAIVAIGTDKGSREMYQKKYRCTPEDYSSVLKLEGGNWIADDKMIANVNESRDCSLAK